MFDIVDRANHKYFIQFIDDKSHQSIIPIITNHVNWGATIHSDGAQVYRCLGNMGYTHNFVVHEHHYIDPLTGVHSNHIENLWSNMKSVLKTIRGSQSDILDRHVDEYTHCYNNKNQGDLFMLLIQDIANFYPV